MKEKGSPFHHEQKCFGVQKREKKRASNNCSINFFVSASVVPLTPTCQDVLHNSLCRFSKLAKVTESSLRTLTNFLSS